MEGSKGLLRRSVLVAFGEEECFASSSSIIGSEEGTVNVDYGNGDGKYLVDDSVPVSRSGTKKGSGIEHESVGFKAVKKERKLKVEE